MVFSSTVFLFYFLPLFLVLYFSLPWKNAVLLVFSLVFYAWGEGVFVFLMIASGIMNYYFARRIAEARPEIVNWVLGAGVALNLLSLIVFKYSGFLVESINHLLMLTLGGRQFLLPAVQLHLPIGISFFTFHAISYLVDVRRGDFPAERDPIKVLLYISMFPQLVAGPIVRFGTVKKEIHERKMTIDKFAIGIKFFIIGLAQKALIANTLALPVDSIHSLPVQSLNAGLAWLSAVGYTLQMYFDFAGYSNMAIGLGLLMGLYFRLNFNYPYISQSITEFWRRWHMTLSSWFRDYLYIPLGGNRAGPFRTYLNLVVVFLLCGLWHGANWTFAIWGLWHGFFLVLERLRLSALLERVGPEFRHLYVLLVVTAGWVFFRANDLPTALAHLQAMAGFGSGDGIVHNVWHQLKPDVALAMLFGGLAATPYLAGLGRRIVDQAPRIIRSGNPELPLISGAITVAALIGVLVLSILQVGSGGYNPFIYFRF